MADAFLLIRDVDGTPLRRVADFGNLACRLAVNKVDRLAFVLPNDHDALSSLARRIQVELWRRDTEHGLDWYRHFSGLYYKQKRVWRDTPTVTVTALGDKVLLARRIIAWPAGTANKSKFTTAKAETISKTLVRYNLTSDATTANGRTRTGANWPASLVTNEADGTGGNTLDVACSNDNLLEVLQKIALIGGGDFDLVKADLNTAALGWVFNWYAGQLGTDRSASVTFSVKRGNLADPEYEIDYENEATAAIVGGRGEGSARTYRTRTGTDFATTNDSEVFVNATDLTTNAGLDAAGDRRLTNTQAREQLDATLLSTESCVYGVHWFLGDKVQVVNPFTESSGTLKVNAVNLEMNDDGATNISGEAATP
jgi:hypothetical protein